MNTLSIAFAFDKIELRANTLNAHRLIHHAQTKVGAGATATPALIEGLFAAQFLAGQHLGDCAVLAAVAAECGMDRAAVERYLDSSEDADEVRAAALEAPRTGINGMPFFIVDKRLAASGAQPPQALLSLIREAFGAKYSASA